MSTRPALLEIAHSVDRVLQQRRPTLNVPRFIHEPSACGCSSHSGPAHHFNTASTSYNFALRIVKPQHHCYHHRHRHRRRIQFIGLSLSQIRDLSSLIPPSLQRCVKISQTYFYFPTQVRDSTFPAPYSSKSIHSPIRERTRPYESTILSYGQFVLGKFNLFPPRTGKVALNFNTLTSFHQPCVR